jgi:glycosyltransferase involved in cell wall biosynthesis
VVTNFCGERFDFIEPENRTFIASTRSSYWKNTASLEEIFKLAKEEVKRSGLPDISLDMSRAMYDNFLEKMRRSYATILISIGDISPNMILDSIRVGTPFIVTEENGIKDIIDKGAIYVDPLNKEQIIEKIVWLSDPNNRKIQAEKVQSIDFIHTWSEIANEIMDIWNKKIKS